MKGGLFLFVQDLWEKTYLTFLFGFFPNDFEWIRVGQFFNRFDCNFDLDVCCFWRPKLHVLNGRMWFYGKVVKKPCCSTKGSRGWQGLVHVPVSNGAPNVGNPPTKVVYVHEVVLVMSQDRLFCKSSFLCSDQLYGRIKKTKIGKFTSMSCKCSQKGKCEGCLQKTTGTVQTNVDVMKKYAPEEKVSSKTSDSLFIDTPSIYRKTTSQTRRPVNSQTSIAPCNYSNFRNRPQAFQRNLMRKPFWTTNKAISTLQSNLLSLHPKSQKFFIVKLQSVNRSFLSLLTP